MFNVSVNIYSQSNCQGTVIYQDIVPTNSTNSLTTTQTIQPLTPSISSATYGGYTPLPIPDGYYIQCNNNSTDSTFMYNLYYSSIVGIFGTEFAITPYHYFNVIYGVSEYCYNIQGQSVAVSCIGNTLNTPPLDITIDDYIFYPNLTTIDTCITSASQGVIDPRFNTTQLVANCVQCDGTFDTAYCHVQQPTVVIWLADSTCSGTTIFHTTYIDESACPINYVSTNLPIDITNPLSGATGTYTSAAWEYGVNCTTNYADSTWTFAAYENGCDPTLTANEYAAPTFTVTGQGIQCVAIPGGSIMVDCVGLMQYPGPVTAPYTQFETSAANPHNLAYSGYVVNFQQAAATWLPTYNRIVAANNYVPTSNPTELKTSAAETLQSYTITAIIVIYSLLTCLLLQ